MSSLKKNPAPSVADGCGADIEAVGTALDNQNDSAAKQTRQEKWRERNPVATWAHSATRSAIRRGIIQPEPCSVCGEPKAEAHHPDHREPLRVIWLCRPCHKAEHRRMKLEGGE